MHLESGSQLTFSPGQRLQGAAQQARRCCVEWKAENRPFFNTQNTHGYFKPAWSFSFHSMEDNHQEMALGRQTFPENHGVRFLHAVRNEMVPYPEGKCTTSINRNRRTDIKYKHRMSIKESKQPGKELASRKKNISFRFYTFTVN
jgi:hypothetical protein